MAADQYRVWFTGKLKDDAVLDEVVQDFAKKFKQTPDKAMKVLSAGREVILKPSADHDTAYRIRSGLEKVGMCVRLEKLEAVSGQDVTTVSDATSDEASDAVSEFDVSSLDMAPVEENPTLSETDLDDEFDEDSADNQVTKTRDVPAGLRPGGSVRAESQEPEPNAVTSDISEPSGTLWKFLLLLLIVAASLGLMAWKFQWLELFADAGGIGTPGLHQHGYDPEVLCMTDQECLAMVEQKVTGCWQQSGLGTLGWSSMSASSLDELRPRIERDYFNCFVDRRSRRLFVTPVTLQYDVIDNCRIVKVEGCLITASRQLRSCYDRHGLSMFVSASTIDLNAVIVENPDVFQSFYGCFTGQNGGQLFQGVLDSWSALYGQT